MRFALWAGMAAAAFAILVLDRVRSFERSLPVYDATVESAAVAAPVRILRDRYAVPHVLAQSYRDAAFGLGYAHAQDRLWQMALARRVIQGRIAEAMGSFGVASDTYMRTLGLYAAARSSLAVLKPETLATLEAYAAGVNAAVAGHAGPLPVEFALTATGFEPWAPEDSVAILKTMALMLSGNAFGEGARARLAARLTPRQLAEFLPLGPDEPDLPLPQYVFDLFRQTTTLGAMDPLPVTTASNNWVVAGTRTESGRPLLANDPHLGMSIPAIWYLAHLGLPGQDLVGGTLPGIPAIIAGRNRTLSWGMTNTGPDTQDLFLERLNPANPEEYETPGGFVPFETREEIIKVRFGADVRLTVRSTRHGPVIPLSDGPLRLAVPEGYVVALAWPALSGADATIESALSDHLATDAAAFDATFRGYVAPMQNIVYASAGGDIGLILPGDVPIRTAENDAQGLVPAKGWDARYDWTGLIPFEELPRVANPAEGWIGTANNRTVPRDFPYVISHEWEARYRYDRIAALIEAQPKHSLETMRAMQLDIVSGYAPAFLARVLSRGPWADERQARAAALLARWDHAMDKDRPEPLIYAAWERALVRRLAADELGDDFPAFWSHRTDFVMRVLDDFEGASRWCDDIATEEPEDCAAAVRAALGDALDELTAAHGGNMERWRWGDAHRIVQSHQPFGFLPVLRDIFNREAPMSGGAFTLRRADYRFSSARPYAAVHGSGYRAVYDMSDPDRSIYVIATGQSGNVYSAHYDDLMPLWLAGEYIEIPTAPAAVESAARHRLTFQPRGASAP